MVFRARQRVYHVTCFECTICKRWLRTGDKYYAINERIFCEHDGKAYKEDKLKGR